MASIRIISTVENIVAMARFPVRGKDVKDGKIEGGVKWGIHKFILRTLLDLGWVQALQGLYGAKHDVW